MASLIDTVRKWFEELFKEQPAQSKGELKKPAESQVLFDDTDTSKELTKLFDEKGNPKDDPPAQAPLNDADYWWCFEGHPNENVPVFESLDPEIITGELNKRIDNDEFPVIEIPSHVMKTLQILNNPNFDYGEVSALVNHSPAMAGEFIRVINSSMFSRGVQINDLKLALPRLGRDNIKALLYMYSSKMCFVKDPLFNELAISIVDHSYAVGLIASFLSQRFYPDPDGAFLAGLLHDIGKLGVLKAVSENFAIPKDLDVKITDEVFDNIFPHLHERAGKFLASNWKINETVMAAIEHHHDFMDTPWEEDEQLAMHLSCIVNISDTMARVLGFGRKIGPTNIFSEPSTIDLSMEKDLSTIKFLDEIPKILSFKAVASSDAASQQQKAGDPKAKPASASRAKR